MKPAQLPLPESNRFAQNHKAQLDHFVLPVVPMPDYSSQ
jgi:hypothetical protein